MNFKKNLLLIACVFTAVQVFAADTEEAEIKGRRKCLKGQNLNICNNASVGGNISGGSFSVSPTPAAGTPGVQGIGGALDWACYYSLQSFPPFEFPLSPNTAIYPFSLVLQESAGSISLNTSTGQITVASAGVYEISWALAFTSGVGGVIADAVFLQVNGSTISAADFGIDVSAGEIPTSKTVIISLNAGDVITIVGERVSDISYVQTGSISIVRIA